MISIRTNVFETNSSSVHTIAVAKGSIDKSELPKTVLFERADYGWEADEIYDTPSYFYSGATREQIDKAVDLLARNGVTVKFDDSETWWGVDHSEDLGEIFDIMLNDEEMFLQFLFGDSCVFTGNDNSHDDTDKCYSGYPTIDKRGDDGHYHEVPNPNHRAKVYDYFVKGN